jgi:class 3 adenylate cyclase/tetratricopeptide (TPR) repeat protein/ABC-type dipeptide/oligopeptide/nickel transport system ATPase component
LIRERAIYCRFCQQMLPLGPEAGAAVGAAVGALGSMRDTQNYVLANLTRLAPQGLRQLLLEDFDAASEAERRVITIMFADICGYTALAEDRDPEYIRDLINRCFEVMAKGVEQYGGMVVHFLGDAVLAAFGVPRAHEDDPERAVRAALDMVEGITKVGRAERLDLGISVGIHTGEVVVGGISVGDRLDFTAFGDAVNTASRLQNVAGFDEILVSQRIQQQVRHAFECESRPPAFVKNKREPIINYKIAGAKGRQLRQRPRGHGVVTDLVGRDKELARIDQVLKSLGEGQPAFLCLVGEPGVGKSRLAHEVHAHLNDPAVNWIEAGAVSFGTSIPYGPILDVLRLALGIEDADSEARIIEKVDDRTRGLKGMTAQTREALAYLLGYTSSRNPIAQLDPKKRKEVLIAESTRYIRGLAARGPVVVVLDDLHWADPLTVEWIDCLVAELGDKPLLVIALYRPTFYHKWPEPAAPVMVDVKELSDQESRRLLLELLGVESIPAKITNKILKRTRGNPFFIEELIHAFKDAGVLVQQGARWEFTQDIEKAPIPDSLRSIILARIDSLEVRLRRVLQCASVIGRGFRYEILEYVTDFQARLDTYLHQLVDVHFLIEQSLLAELMYLFRHAVARDVTYATLLRRRRAEFHRKVGECIESLHPGQLERHYEFLAHHFYYSDSPQKAAYYLEHASDKLEHLYANEAAIEAVERLIEVLDRRLPKTNEYARMRAEALVRLGRLHKLLGHYPDATVSYQRAIRVADRLGGGEDLAAKARRNLADVDRIMGRHSQALRNLDRAGEIWGHIGDEKNRLTIHNSRGVVYMSQGKYAQAARAFRQGVELARTTGALPALANALNDFGVACLHAAQYDEALKTFQESLGVMEEVGDKRGVVAILNNIGMCHERLGRFGEAINHYGRSFELAEKIGHRYAVLSCLINMGQCYQYQGDHRDAIRQFRRVVRFTNAHPNDYIASVAFGNWATNLLCINQAADAQQRLHEARRLARASRNHLARVNVDMAETLYLITVEKFGQAERLARSTIDDIEKAGYNDYASLGWRYLAEALLGRNNAAEARRAADRALKLARHSGSPRDQAWAMWTRSRIEQSQGRASSARSLIGEARGIAERIGDKALVAATEER